MLELAPPAEITLTLFETRAIGKVLIDYTVRRDVVSAGHPV